MAEERYVQCLLGRNGFRRTAWIPERGARKGARVELKVHPQTDLWTVIEPYPNTAMDESQLKEHQRQHRGSLPSVQSVHRSVNHTP